MQTVSSRLVCHGWVAQDVARSEVLRYLGFRPGRRLQDRRGKDGECDSGTPTPPRVDQVTFPRGGAKTRPVLAVSSDPKSSPHPATPPNNHEPSPMATSGWLRRTPPAQGGLLGAVMVGAVKENRATSSAKAEQRLAGACA